MYTKTGDSYIINFCFLERCKCREAAGTRLLRANEGSCNNDAHTFYRFLTLFPYSCPGMVSLTCTDPPLLEPCWKVYINSANFDNDFHTRLVKNYNILLSILVLSLYLIEINGRILMYSDLYSGNPSPVCTSLLDET